MKANLVFHSMTLFTRSLVALGALLLLATPGRALSNLEPAGALAQEGSRGRNQQKPRSKPAPRQGQQTGKQTGKRRGQSGASRPQGNGQRAQKRGQNQRKEGQRPQNGGTDANAQRAANARAQAERAKAQKEGQGRAQNTANGTRAANAREQAEQKQAREQGRQVPVGTRAENARRQKLEADQSSAQRVKNARDQAAAQGAAAGQTEPNSGQRAKAVREQREANRIANARSQGLNGGDLAPAGATSQRAANARRQRAARIGSAERQMTPAQKAQRIGNARRQFAALSPEQDTAARRFMAAQHVHNDRMARMQRIEDLLTTKSDEANLARVRALRAKQVALNERDREALSTVLGPDQMRAVEDTVEIGTRTARGESN